MTLSNILIGFITGFPVMIVVGPIALLLIEAGMERGVQGAFPAALGASGADLLYATLSALVGVAAVEVLQPVESWLSLSAVALLFALAVRLAWRAAAQLWPDRVGATATGAAATAAMTAATAPMAATVKSATTATAAGTATAPHTDSEIALVARAATPHAMVERGRLALAGGFFGLTALNPVTVAVFAAIVLGGAGGVGTAGWVLGMVLASLVVNLGFVLVGHGLGAVLDPPAVAWVRLGAAASILAMALHFALG